MEKPTEAITEPTPRGCHHTMCVPFANEEKYRELVADPVAYRAYLTEYYGNHPEVFPAGFGAGWEFHSRYWLKKLGLPIRRVKVRETGAVYGIRPSLVLPYGVAWTEAVAPALGLLRDGVGGERLAETFGRNQRFWERLRLSVGRVSVVGTTVKEARNLPVHLVADEKVTWLNGVEWYLATTAAAGCVLGVGLTQELSGTSLATAYGEFLSEARQLDQTYQPRTVTSDGFRATRAAWRTLLPSITLILCYLHGILKVAERCRGPLREQVTDRLWHVYHAPSQAAFSQRLRHLRTWATTSLDGSVQSLTLKVCDHRDDYTPAYRIPDAPRTTAHVDRLMDFQDRLLYAQRYLHGTPHQARLTVRAMALLWNFHPYGRHTKARHPERHSPFADLNGFVYHDHWLHNFLIAASLGGSGQQTRPHKIRGD